jgi:hypothetical protein
MLIVGNQIILIHIKPKIYEGLKLIKIIGIQSVENSFIICKNKVKWNQ